MAIRITAVHIAAGTEPDDIAEVEWVSIEHKNEGCSTRDAIVEWLESSASNVAVVGRGAKSTPVQVVRENGRVLLRAALDSSPNRLLELPRY